VEYDDEDVADEGLHGVYAKRKKKKKRKVEEPYLFAGLSYFAAMMLGLLLLGVALGVGTFFLPLLFIAAVVIGGAIALVSGILFVVNAFQDDGVGAGLCCLFIPFYGLYYLLTHWERERRPFFLYIMGFLILSAGLGVWVFKQVSSAKNTSAAAAAVTPGLSANP
jgi:hypothetical protein